MSAVCFLLNFPLFLAPFEEAILLVCFTRGGVGAGRAPNRQLPSWCTGQHQPGWRWSPAGHRQRHQPVQHAVRRRFPLQIVQHHRSAAPGRTSPSPTCPHHLHALFVCFRSLKASSTWWISRFPELSVGNEKPPWTYPRAPSNPKASCTRWVCTGVKGQFRKSVNVTVIPPSFLPQDTPVSLWHVADSLGGSCWGGLVM